MAPEDACGGVQMESPVSEADLEEAVDAFVEALREWASQGADVDMSSGVTLSGVTLRRNAAFSCLDGTTLEMLIRYGAMRKNGANFKVAVPILRKMLGEEDVFDYEVVLAKGSFSARGHTSGAEASEKSGGCGASINFAGGIERQVAPWPQMRHRAEQRPHATCTVPASAAAGGSGAPAATGATTPPHHQKRVRRCGLSGSRDRKHQRFARDENDTLNSSPRKLDSPAATLFSLQPQHEEALMSTDATATLSDIVSTNATRNGRVADGHACNNSTASALSTNTGTSPPNDARRQAVEARIAADDAACEKHLEQTVRRLDLGEDTARLTYSPRRRARPARIAPEPVAKRMECEAIATNDLTVPLPSPASAHATEPTQAVETPRASCSFFETLSGRPSIVPDSQRAIARAWLLDGPDAATCASSRDAHEFVKRAKAQEGAGSSSRRELESTFDSTLSRASKQVTNAADTETVSTLAHIPVPTAGSCKAAVLIQTVGVHSFEGEAVVKEFASISASKSTLDLAPITNDKKVAAELCCAATSDASAAHAMDTNACITPAELASNAISTGMLRNSAASLTSQMSSTARADGISSKVNSFITTSAPAVSADTSATAIAKDEALTLNTFFKKDRPAVSRPTPAREGQGPSSAQRGAHWNAAASLPHTVFTDPMLVEADAKTSAERNEEAVARGLLHGESSNASKKRQRDSLYGEFPSTQEDQDSGSSAAAKPKVFLDRCSTSMATTACTAPIASSADAKTPQAPAVLLEIANQSLASSNDPQKVSAASENVVAMETTCVAAAGIGLSEVSVFPSSVNIDSSNMRLEASDVQLKASELCFNKSESTPVESEAPVVKMHAGALDATHIPPAEPSTIARVEEVGSSTPCPAIDSPTLVADRSHASEAAAAVNASPNATSADNHVEAAEQSKGTLLAACTEVSLKPALDAHCSEDIPFAGIDSASDANAGSVQPKAVRQQTAIATAGGQTNSPLSPKALANDSPSDSDIAHAAVPFASPSAILCGVCSDSSSFIAVASSVAPTPVEAGAAVTAPIPTNTASDAADTSAASSPALSPAFAMYVTASPCSGFPTGDAPEASSSASAAAALTTTPCLAYSGNASDPAAARATTAPEASTAASILSASASVESYAYAGSSVGTADVASSSAPASAAVAAAASTSTATTVPYAAQSSAATAQTNTSASSSSRAHSAAPVDACAASAPLSCCAAAATPSASPCPIPVPVAFTPAPPALFTPAPPAVCIPGPPAVCTSCFAPTIPSATSPSRCSSSSFTAADTAPSSAVDNPQVGDCFLPLENQQQAEPDSNLPKVLLAYAGSELVCEAAVESRSPRTNACSQAHSMDLPCASDAPSTITTAAQQALESCCTLRECNTHDASAQFSLSGDAAPSASSTAAAKTAPMQLSDCIEAEIASQAVEAQESPSSLPYEHCQPLEDTRGADSQGQIEQLPAKHLIINAPSIAVETEYSAFMQLQSCDGKRFSNKEVETDCFSQSVNPQATTQDGLFRLQPEAQTSLTSPNKGSMPEMSSSTSAAEASQSFSAMLLTCASATDLTQGAHAAQSVRFDVAESSNCSSKGLDVEFRNPPASGSAEQTPYSRNKLESPSNQASPPNDKIGAPAIDGVDGKAPSPAMIGPSAFGGKETTSLLLRIGEGETGAEHYKLQRASAPGSEGIHLSFSSAAQEAHSSADVGSQPHKAIPLSASLFEGVLPAQPSQPPQPSQPLQPQLLQPQPLQQPQPHSPQPQLLQLQPPQLQSPRPPQPAQPVDSALATQSQLSQSLPRLTPPSRMPPRQSKDNSSAAFLAAMSRSLSVLRRFIPDEPRSEPRLIESRTHALSFSQPQADTPPFSQPKAETPLLMESKPDAPSFSQPMADNTSFLQSRAGEPSSSQPEADKSFCSLKETESHTFLSTQADAPSLSRQEAETPSFLQSMAETLSSTQAKADPFTSSQPKTDARSHEVASVAPSATSKQATTVHADGLPAPILFDAALPPKEAVYAIASEEELGVNPKASSLPPL